MSVILVSTLLSALVLCIPTKSENYTNENISGDLKIFDFLFRPPQPVIPTPAQSEFLPGVPPGYPIAYKPPTTPTIYRPSSPKPITENLSNTVPVRIEDVDIFSTSTNYPYILSPNFTNPEVNNNNNEGNRGFLDWLLGILGFGGGVPGGEETGPVEPPKYCPECKCGRIYKGTRIVGGVQTKVNQYPWMTALTYNGRFYCGATLINDRYILTAAHCVHGFSKERLSATFLDHDRANNFEAQTIQRGISRILKHQYYSKQGLYNNDIALLKLDRPLQLTGLLKPVCLPPIGSSFTGNKSVAVGWGATQVHGQISTVLREVEVPILSNRECRRTGYASRITDNMLCAGYKEGMKDSCQGDSGGPLHVNKDPYYMIVGITSWGEGCAEPNYPGVYTRVNRYISWIKSNTRDACLCDP